MAQSDRKCYFPNGVLADTNVPCTNDEFTACCDYRDICLSNGYCMATTNQPYTLSRGSCTNQKWEQGCPERCGNDTLGCSNGEEPFQVPDAEALPGVAVLGNVTSFDAPNSTNSNTTCTLPSPSSDAATCSGSNGSCHETAIGAGVGVPLGVIALASVAWALWERRKGEKALAAAVAAASTASSKPPGVFDGGAYGDVNVGKRGGLSELDSQRPIAELNT
ncbi:hypothetical protein BDV18DRAFT_160957 [Aspergillus unguis]